MVCTRGGNPALPVLSSLKETIMHTADMLIYVHPELEAQTRKNLERKIMGRIGVDCAEFEHKPHPHSLLVRYDPEEVEGIELLHMVRKIDPAASMVGM
jgi:hypothetical protein